MINLQKYSIYSALHVWFYTTGLHLLFSDTYIEKMDMSSSSSMCTTVLITWITLTLVLVTTKCLLCTWRLDGHWVWRLSTNCVRSIHNGYTVNRSVFACKVAWCHSLFFPLLACQVSASKTLPSVTYLNKTKVLAHCHLAVYRYNLYKDCFKDRPSHI